MAQIMTFNEAVDYLVKELNYPRAKALSFAKSFDHNHDGKLSANEVIQFRSTVQETKDMLVPKFKEFDADGNGFISLKEASDILQAEPFQFPPNKVVFLLSKFDKDSNGKLDIEEFADFYSEAKAINEEITKLFASLDADGNGVLSPDEVISILKEKLGFDDQMAMFMVKMFDSNNDGNLDKTEFIQMWSSMFGN